MQNEKNEKEKRVKNKKKKIERMKSNRPVCLPATSIQVLKRKSQVAQKRWRDREWGERDRDRVSRVLIIVCDSTARPSLPQTTIMTAENQLKKH